MAMAVPVFIWKAAMTVNAKTIKNSEIKSFFMLDLLLSAEYNESFLLLSIRDFTSTSS